jgi:hypothetical protein
LNFLTTVDAAAAGGEGLGDVAGAVIQGPRVVVEEADVAEPEVGADRLVVAVTAAPVRCAEVHAVATTVTATSPHQALFTEPRLPVAAHRGSLHRLPAPRQKLRQSDPSARRR